jgi:hypothetical protein
VEDIVIPVAGMLFVIVLVIGIPIVRAYTKRIERGDALSFSNPETNERLDRIEHAIDAMAVEVERIAEGQRFVTKILAQRAPEQASLQSGRAGGSTS